MDRAELREVLEDEFDMQPKYIEAVMNQIDGFEDGFKNIFFTFLHTKAIPDVKVGEYDLKCLVEKHNFREIGAFLFLDWMQKDMEYAKTAFLFF